MQKKRRGRTPLLEANSGQLFRIRSGQQPQNSREGIASLDRVCCLRRNYRMPPTSVQQHEAGENQDESAREMRLKYWKSAARNKLSFRRHFTQPKVVTKSIPENPPLEAVAYLTNPRLAYTLKFSCLKAFPWTFARFIQPLASCKFLHKISG